MLPSPPHGTPAEAGWRRWAAGSEDLGALSVGTSLAVSAAALLVAYGFRGALAEYLPGGINAARALPLPVEPATEVTRGA